MPIDSRTFASRLSALGDRLTGMRYGGVAALLMLYLALGAVVRLVLWWQFGRDADVAVTQLPLLFGVGALHDLAAGLLLLVPYVLYLTLLPRRAWASTTNRGIVLGFTALTLAVLAFGAVSEYFFFEEFDARFNLVAFDYLMYPTEVIGDIRDAYPVNTVLALVAVLGIAGAWLLRRPMLGGESTLSAGRRWVLASGYMAVTAVSFATVSVDTLAQSTNRVANELAMNGLATFAYAARTSEIDYPAYYATRDPRSNLATLVQHMDPSQASFTHLDQGRLNRRFAANPRGLGRLNVVVVVEESLGAEFSGAYGGTGLTPNLDALGEQGVRFSHVYASGTRTVRGLEAIAASFPPIPSVSILRRPGNEHIATWGSVMHDAGYHTSFLYGGYGYFDNMNYFFGENGFEILDRAAIDKVRFENIWGVSDEDLLDRAIEHFDERARTGQPFFSIIMSTSNHKPFTFREGIPGVPATGGGRAAGVRYADFAIGQFIANARSHPWFDDTLFVFVADHGARVYGKADIPLRTYEIPLVLYSPRHLQPRVVDRVTAQVDIAPTVLGLLGVGYEAPFFGQDVLSPGAGDSLVYVSHNHDVGVLQGNRLVVLGLGGQVKTLEYRQGAETYRKVGHDLALEQYAIAAYQTGYELFRSRQYR